jgi:hypothetical protein
MTVVVHIARRISAATLLQGALVGQAHFGPAALMADCVSVLVRLHPADRGDRDPALTYWV